MVGVPGRSKGCSTCRRRKKGCDFQRPVCGLCYRLGLECGGYGRERIFIHAVAEAAGIASRPKALTAQERTRAAAPPLQHRRGSSADSPEITPPERLTWAASEQKYLGLFWESYLPNGLVFPSGATAYATGGWTNVVHDLYRDSPVLRLSLLANCLATLGQRDHKRWMVEEGVKAYGSALVQLQKIIREPSLATGDAIIGAVRLLIIFSIFCGNIPGDNMAPSDGWWRHTHGTLALVLARKPEAYISGHAHQLFVDVRLPIIIGAMKQRKKTILGSPEWMTIPWSSEIPKSSKDKLVDIMAEMPALLESIDMMTACGNIETQSRLRRNLKNRTVRINKALQAWYRNDSPHKEFSAMTARESDNLTTEELSIAYIMAIFGSGCVFMDGTMRLLGVEQVSQQSEAMTHIRSIIRCIKYFFHPSSGRFGIEITPFPLGMVAQFFQANPSEGREEREMLSDLYQTKRGEEVRRFLISLQMSNEVYHEGHSERPRGTQAWPFLKKQGGSE